MGVEAESEGSSGVKLKVLCCVVQEEEEEDGEEDTVEKQDPTHYSELDPKSMKVRTVHE